MAKRGYYDEVKRRIAEQVPDTDPAHLLTYEEIAREYGPRFQALGFKVSTSADTSGTLRALTSRRILHRYEHGGAIKIPRNEIETYLQVLEEPRPVA